MWGTAYHMINKGISLGMIKWVALVAMTLDHIGFFFPELGCSAVLRHIGRIAFPMFSFLIAYHLISGVPARKYLIRIGLFWFLTLLVMGMMTGYESYFRQMNVLGTLWFGVLGICIGHQSDLLKGYPIGSVFLKGIILALALIGSGYVGYNVFGFGYMIAFYEALKRKTVLPLAFLLALTPYLESFRTIDSLIAALATTVLYIIPVRINHGWRLKWYWFYGYFPVHLGILYGIRCWLG